LRYKLAFVDAGATAPLVFDAPVAKGLYLEGATHQVLIDGKPVEPPLSPQQYRLLELVYSSTRIVSRDDIARSLWPETLEGAVSEQSIDALVRRLRERLAEVDPVHQYLVTMRGHGFRFENKT
jgi:DNA-binding response OmpR family regulator